MELNDLIPLKFTPIDCNWVVRGKYLMYKHYEHIPMAFINNGVVYIFLENKIQNQVLKLTKWVMKLGCEFYLTSPELSNPKGIENIEEHIITHYMYSYAQFYFFKGFKKIEFDLIKNMVDWCIKEKCTNLIKKCYDSIIEKIEYHYYDYFKNKNVNEYSLEIRDDFKTLYRDIQINMII